MSRYERQYDRLIVSNPYARTSKAFQHVNNAIPIVINTVPSFRDIAVSTTVRPIASNGAHSVRYRIPKDGAPPQ